ncbi:hypothetical protein CMO83_04815 [Candidatus Woesearchaeota archaeon]|jgi:hypothetical protein|nr:hypothetical protein [Candidatus Woesearchaeota archaeon]MDP6648212.1 hypothetical protein [Candidatus Woesearchaeota archaeon]|tara:strand:- start:33055 stop:33714 length:660 start_codon:yes stop_codon:yes gene_type:complete
MSDIALHVHPTPDNWFPPELFGAVQESTQRAFLHQRNSLVDREFFQRNNPLSPTRLEALVIGGAANGEMASNSMVEDYIVDGIRFKYVNKASVAPPHNGNGLLVDMMDEVIAYAQAMNPNIPVVVRTSVKEISQGHYAEIDDIRTERDGYYIHGFGFLERGTGKERFEGARSAFLDKIAPYIAAKPSTVHSIGSDRARSLLLHPFALRQGYIVKPYSSN